MFAQGVKDAHIDKGADVCSRGKGCPHRTMEQMFAQGVKDAHGQWSRCLLRG